MQAVEQTQQAAGQEPAGWAGSAVPGRCSLRASCLPMWGQRTETLRQEEACRWRGRGVDSGSEGAASQAGEQQARFRWLGPAHTDQQEPRAPWAQDPWLATFRSARCLLKCRFWAQPGSRAVARPAEVPFPFQECRWSPESASQAARGLEHQEGRGRPLKAGHLGNQRRAVLAPGVQWHGPQGPWLQSEASVEVHAPGWWLCLEESVQAARHCLGPCQGKLAAARHTPRAALPAHVPEITRPGAALPGDVEAGPARLNSPI